MMKSLFRSLKWLIFPPSYRDFMLVPAWTKEKSLGKREANLLLKIKKPIGWEHLILLFPEEERGGKILALLCNAHKWRKGYVSLKNDFVHQDGRIVSFRR